MDFKHSDETNKTTMNERKLHKQNTHKIRVERKMYQKQNIVCRAALNGQITLDRPFWAIKLLLLLFFDN